MTGVLWPATRETATHHHRWWKWSPVTLLLAGARRNRNPETEDGNGSPAHLRRRVFDPEMHSGTGQGDRNEVTELIHGLAGRWQISDDEGQYAFAGNVPGTVQGDLVQQGLAPHPYVGSNETAMRDLENKSWTYIKEFELDDLPTEENVELVLSLIHISEPTRLGMISYAVFCLKKKKKK